MTAARPLVGDQPGRQAVARRVLWTVFVGAFLVIGGWSISNPLMAAPDEPAHAVKAAATVRLQFSADESEYNPGRGTFEVPALFAQIWQVPCFGFQPETAASCFTGFDGDLARPSESTSHVARYNPVYYALVGLPSLAGSSEVTLYAMRLVGAALNALLVALAARTVAELRRWHWPAAALVASLTPMTFFVFSSLTPQGPEIAGAAVTWLLLLALTREPDDALLTQRMWRLVVASGLFVIARGLSPAYLLLVIAAVVLAAPRPAVVLDLVRNSRIWPQIAACAALAVAGVVYTLASGSLALGIVLPDETLTARGVVRTMLGNTSAYLEQLLGVFGWGDTHLSLWTLLLAGSVVLLVLLVGLAFGTLRERLAVGAVVVATFLLPIVVQLQSFRETGMVWQGKYVMPLAIGALLIAGFGAEREPMTAAVARPLLRAVVAVVAVVQVTAVAVNLHRNVNGVNGSWFTVTSESWTPPGGPVLWLVVQALLWAGVLVLAWRVTRRPLEGDRPE
ncbi:DUF2142 domain-containing protein [Cellulomonas endometrii]|uniref:DUF2142 domain-containing protein n=1 Tax=Cellulomonas endometrii TaxID=3036301 RepID=UPI0024ADC413|nr:DUF2142 domain-containing protein [Cellulomonas endometrii]